MVGYQVERRVRVRTRLAETTQLTEKCTCGAASSRKSSTAPTLPTDSRTSSPSSPTPAPAPTTTTEPRLRTPTPAPASPTGPDSSPPPSYSPARSSVQRHRRGDDKSENGEPKNVCRRPSRRQILLHPRQPRPSTSLLSHNRKNNRLPRYSSRERNLKRLLRRGVRFVFTAYSWYIRLGGTHQCRMSMYVRSHLSFTCPHLHPSCPCLPPSPTSGRAPTYLTPCFAYNAFWLQELQFEPWNVNRKTSLNLTLGVRPLASLVAFGVSVHAYTLGDGRTTRARDRDRACVDN
ncbi:hypothetical protein V8E53_011148 [Lactarius tabidus]